MSVEATMAFAMAFKGGGPDNELGCKYKSKYNVVCHNACSYIKRNIMIFTKPNASSASLAMASKTTLISSLFCKGVLKKMVVWCTLVSFGNS